MKLCKIRAGRATSRPARGTAGQWGDAPLRQLGGKPCFHPKMRRSRGNPQQTDKGRQNKRQSCPAATERAGWQHGGLGQGAGAARAWWGHGAARGRGFSPPPAQRCPGRGQGTSQQTRASGCGCCWGLRVPVPRASSDRSSPPGWVQHPAAPPPWHPLWWEHKQHLSSAQVLPSDTLRALQAPELSSQDARDLPKPPTAPSPLYRFAKSALTHLVRRAR